MTRSTPALLPRNRSTEESGPVLIVAPEGKIVPTFKGMEGPPPME